MQRGFYDVYTFVCEQDGIPCFTVASFEQTRISPQQIYLTTKSPNATYSTADGDGLIRAVVSRMETFTVYMRDKYNNSFDVHGDILHRGIPSKDDFLLVELITDDSKKGQVSVPIYQRSADYFNGVFTYVYTIEEPHDGDAIISIKVLNTEEAIAQHEANGLTPLQIETYPYDAGFYKHVNGSPFNVSSQSTSNKLLESYQDILLGGWALTARTFMRNHGPARIPSTSPFRLDIYGKDIFNISFVQQLSENSAIAAEKLVLIDFYNHEDKCIRGSQLSRMKRYCQFSSFSYEECVNKRMC